MVEQKKRKHSTKPAIAKLFNLCTNPVFKQKVIELRRKWKMTTLARSPDEANKFWQSLCETDRKKRNYHENYDEGKTQAQMFQHNLEQLCQDPAFGLPIDSNMWLVIFQIVLRLDLDSLKDEDILTLPLVPSLDRCPVVPMNNRLYLDVTFATRKDDVPEIWEVVEYWQKQIRPAYIIRGLLPDLTEGIKPGRPTDLTDDVCREAVRLKDEERWTYPKIGQRFGWKYQESAVNRGGKVTRSRCRTAEEAVKRGRKLNK
jgi:hypothetical protein